MRSTAFQGIINGLNPKFRLIFLLEKHAKGQICSELCCVCASCVYDHELCCDRLKGVAEDLAVFKDTGCYEVCKPQVGMKYRQFRNDIKLFLRRVDHLISHCMRICVRVEKFVIWQM